MWIFMMVGVRAHFACHVLMLGVFLAPSLTLAQPCAPSSQDDAAVSLRLAQIADLSGLERIAALDTFVQAAAQDSGSISTCLPVLAISRAAMLYPDAGEQTRVMQIALALQAVAALETAAIPARPARGITASFATESEAAFATPNTRAPLGGTIGRVAVTHGPMQAVGRPATASRGMPFGGVQASAN